jgi:hypothetical protein
MARLIRSIQLLMVFHVIALAQSAQVGGRVLDNSGAVVPDVKITIKNLENRCCARP